jgi:hypothetical protein
MRELRTLPGHQYEKRVLNMGWVEHCLGLADGLNEGNQGEFENEGLDLEPLPSHILHM